MLHPNAVAQMNHVMVARPAAIGFIGARGHHRAKHAVLHVEHGHVLVNYDFQPRGRHGGDQVDQLLAIQIVRGGDALRPLLPQVLGRQLVGAVEREIGDHAQVPLAEESQARQIAHQDSVGAIRNAPLRITVS